MRLISWNVNGIRAVHARGDLDWLWTSDADVVCLQETKLQAADVPPALLKLEGWHSYWSSGKKKGYSGVVTFVREHLPQDDVAKGFGEARFDTEGRIQITDHEVFVLLNIYFPNGGRGPEHVAHKLAFYDKCESLVNAYVDEGRDVVICGDVNTAHQAIDTARPDVDVKYSGFLPEERAFLDRFFDEGWVDTFRSEHPAREGAFTWWSYQSDGRPDNIGMRIDYFLVNESLSELVEDAWISPQIMGSDHCPVGLELAIGFADDDEEEDEY
ncbi:MAG: exodeoxyribonuclease III [Deltaproteobacteria bacterium]|nr:exodeoxyribonuclease III [Deltaproteobacteria bacterium]